MSNGFQYQDSKHGILGYGQIFYHSLHEIHTDAL